MIPPAPTDARPRILVADDDPAIRELLRLTFETAGFDVIVAENGLEASQKAKLCRPDVLVTDLAMPQREGLETLRWFQLQFPETAAIAISGAFSGPVLRSALLLGARAVMEKPLSLAALLTLVRSLVGNQPVASSA